MATSLLTSSQLSPKHHYVRTLISSLFGSVAASLIILSIVVVWLDRTLTNTDQYVKTVAPLVSEPDVQNFVINKASGVLLDNKETGSQQGPGVTGAQAGQDEQQAPPIRDIATEVLGAEQVAGKTDEQLQAEIEPVVKDTLRSIVTSPSFAALWEKSNRDVHGQLLSQLKSGSDTIKLDFHPVIVSALAQLETTKFAFVAEKLELKPDVGVMTVRGDQLDTVHKIYDYFKKAMLAIIACAVLAAVLAVIISVHHWKTFRRIAMSTGIFSASLAVMLSATSLIRLNGLDAEQQKIAVTLVNGITADLRTALIVVAVACIGGALVSKVCITVMARKKTTAKATAKRA